MRDRNSMIKGLMGALLLAPCAVTLAAEAPCCASDDNHRPSAVAPRMAFADAAPCCASDDNHLMAATPAGSLSQLGASNPSTPNVSLSPDYQVYLFTRDAVRYVELADASGTPRAAFTVVSGGLLSLPVGVDAVQQVAVAPAWTEVVYSDTTVIVGRRVSDDGATIWQVFVK